jgi:hypothetical protein
MTHIEWTIPAFKGDEEMNNVESAIEARATFPELEESTELAQAQQSGLILKKVAPELARTLLAELDQFDEAEQRETFEHLQRALNETRAAHGERLIFPNEQTYSA